MNRSGSSYSAEVQGGVPGSDGTRFQSVFLINGMQDGTDPGEYPSVTSVSLPGLTVTSSGGTTTATVSGSTYYDIKVVNGSPAVVYGNTTQGDTSTEAQIGSITDSGFN